MASLSVGVMRASRSAGVRNWAKVCWSERSFFLKISLVSPSVVPRKLWGTLRIQAQLHPNSKVSQWHSSV